MSKKKIEQHEAPEALDAPAAQNVLEALDASAAEEALEALDAPAAAEGAADALDTATASAEADPKARNAEAPASVKAAPVRIKQGHYVNKMLNIGRVAGFCVSANEENGILLQQNNNIEHALRIVTQGTRARLAAMVGRPLTVTVHMRGYRDEFGPQLSVHYLRDERPSILDMPLEKVWGAGFGLNAAATLRRLGQTNFSPFDPNGDIKPEYAKYISTSDKESQDFELNEEAREFIRSTRVMHEIAEISGATSAVRGSAGLNFAKVAGIVDRYMWIPENEFRSAYGLILLRQHGDESASLPIRVTGGQARKFMNALRVGLPILVRGNIRRKVIPDDQGNVRSRHTYIETQAISPAIMDQDILMPLPTWLDELPMREQKAREARRAAHEARVAESKAKRSAAPAGTIVPPPPAMPDPGVGAEAV